MTRFEATYIWCFFVLCLLLAGAGHTVSSLHALDPDEALHHYLSDQWQIKDNMPANRVNRIIRSSDGYIWLATSSGLVRFDGIRFTVYNKASHPELGSDYVSTVYQDGSGCLWIGSRDGLCFLNEGRFTSFFRSDEHENLGVWTIFEETSSGRLWVGLDGAGLMCIDNGAVIARYTTLNGLIGDKVRSLIPDDDGGLWIGATTGLCRLKDGEFTDYTGKDVLPHPSVKTVYRDRDGALWIGTYGGGLCRFDNGKVIIYHTDSGHGFPNNYVRVVFQDSEGTLWVGTRAGLSRLKNGAFTTILLDAGSPYTLINAICEDHEKNLWVGTHSKGLFRLRDRIIKSYTGKDGLSDSVAFSLYMDGEGVLWVGMRDGLYRGEAGEFSRFTVGGESFYGVNSICEDRDGRLWIGTESGGLKRLQKSKTTGAGRRFEMETFNIIADGGNVPVRCVFADPEGRVYAGTGGKGVTIFKNGDRKTYTSREGLPGDNVRTFFRDRDGDIWIGADVGLARLRDGKFTVYTTRDGLSGNVIASIFQDSRGVLWVGTYEDGLNRFKDGKFIPVTSANGLHADSVYEILEDVNENLWFGSKKGIFRVPLGELDDFFAGRRERVTCKAYDENDGMLNRQCSGGGVRGASLKTADGIFWFATARGIVKLDPRDLKRNPVPPPVRIEQLTADDQTFNLFQLGGTPLTLPAGVKEFQFAYTALSLINPVRNRFKYKLEGFDTHWKNVGNRRTAYYTNLSPGRFRFRVMACNNDGVWNHEGDVFEFHLQPHFYQTWWFYLLCGVLFVFLTAGIYRIRVRRLQTHQSVLEKLVGKRTYELETSNLELSVINEQLQLQQRVAEEANRSKSDFLARMSHEIRTPMNGVVGFADMLMDTKLDEEQRDYVKTISRSGEALVLLINDILDFSRIEAGEMTFDPIDFDPELTAFDVCDIVQPRLGAKPVEVACRIADDVPAYVRSDAGRFRQVLINLMGNAVKFTEEGEVVLSLAVEKREEKRILLHSTVKDTGIGISGDKLETIFDVFRQADGSTTRKYGGAGLGLAICKQIASLMGGDVRAESTPGKGSTFHFTAWVETSQKKSKKEIPLDYMEGKRALLVDDNLTNLEILTHVLTRWGMRVKAVNKPAETIPLIRESFSEGDPFHLCVLDIRMPEISGYRVAQSIRALEPPMSKLPLLAFSSSTLARSKKFENSGFDAFLPKPVRRKKLLKMTARLLGKGEDVEEEGKQEEFLTRHSIAEDEKHGIHILLVEDNPVNQKLARFMLTKAGYRLTVANNGAEAVDIYSAAPDDFDLIFMDIHMPKMDGLEATRKIREFEASIQNSKFKIQSSHRVPIIAMTADSMKGDRERCLAAGMDDYMAKPIRREKVFEIIKNRHAPHAGGPAPHAGSPAPHAGGSD